MVIAFGIIPTLKRKDNYCQARQFNSKDLGYVMQLVLKITKTMFISELNDQFLNEHLTDHMALSPNENPQCFLDGLKSSNFRVTDMNFYHCDSKNQCPQTSQFCKTDAGSNGNVLMSITFRADSAINLLLYGVVYPFTLGDMTVIVNFLTDYDCDRDILQLTLGKTLTDTIFKAQPWNVVTVMNSVLSSLNLKPFTKENFLGLKKYILCNAVTYPDLPPSQTSSSTKEHFTVNPPTQAISYKECAMALGTELLKIALAYYTNNPFSIVNQDKPCDPVDGQQCSNDYFSACCSDQQLLSRINLSCISGTYSAKQGIRTSVCAIDGLPNTSLNDAFFSVSDTDITFSFILDLTFTVRVYISLYGSTYNLCSTAVLGKKPQGVLKMNGSAQLAIQGTFPYRMDTDGRSMVLDMPVITYPFPTLTPQSDIKIQGTGGIQKIYCIVSMPFSSLLLPNRRRSMMKYTETSRNRYHNLSILIYPSSFRNPSQSRFTCCRTLSRINPLRMGTCTVFFNPFPTRIRIWISRCVRMERRPLTYKGQMTDSSVRQPDKGSDAHGRRRRHPKIKNEPHDTLLFPNGCHDDAMPILLGQ